MASLPGCPALATASWAIAAAQGVEDGGAIGAGRRSRPSAWSAGRWSLPVSADLEAGYGDAGATVAAAIEAGAVGCNLEDGRGPLELHAARAPRRARRGEAAGVPLVINARTDVFLAPGPRRRRGDRPRLRLPGGGRGLRLRHRRRRARPPAGDERRVRRPPLGLRRARLARPLSELAALGVGRVTFGPGLMGAAHAALRDAAETLLAGGAPPASMAFRPRT